MAHRAPKHFVDRLVEWAGSLLFAAGMAVAAWKLFDPKVAALAASASFATAFGLISNVGRKAARQENFQPAELWFDHAREPAPRPEAANDELLLDDPLITARDSRATRLFAADAASPAVLVARIEDYLDRDPLRQGKEQEVRRDEPLPDASAALHAALANIRASLR